MNNDLRELVARTMGETQEDVEWATLLDGNKMHGEADHYYVIADAVLAALADAGALMPELPEGWRITFVDWERYEGVDNLYVARVERVDDDGEYHNGTGPTIAAAIANALEGAAK
jgi:hypothetical protein